MSAHAEPSRPAAAGDVAERGVIHDIGYRHYDGPRLDSRYVRRSLFVESVKGAYGLGRSARSKVMPLLLLAAMSLPALVMVVVTAVTGAPELPLGYSDYLLNMQVVIAIFVAAQAPTVVSRDLRFGTMPLYLSRPLKRGQYVQAKYAAMTAAVVVLLAVPLSILFSGALLAKLPVAEQAPDYLRGLAGALLYALVLSGISLVIAALTPRRGVGVAAVIAVLLVLSGVQGAVLGIAGEFGRDALAGYSALLSPFTLVDVTLSTLLGGENALGTEPPGTLGDVSFVAFTALVIVAGYGILLRRYRRLGAA